MLLLVRESVQCLGENGELRTEQRPHNFIQKYFDQSSTCTALHPAANCVQTEEERVEKSNKKQNSGCIVRLLSPVDSVFSLDQHRWRPVQSPTQKTTVLAAVSVTPRPAAVIDSKAKRHDGSVWKRSTPRWRDKRGVEPSMRK